MSENTYPQKQEAEQRPQTSAQLQMHLALEITEALSEIQGLNTLLAKVVDLAASRFGYQYIYLYLLEDDKLIFRDGISQSEHRLKELGHQIPLSSQSLVAKAARQRKPILVKDVSKLQAQLPNILFANTQSELVVPIKLGSKVLAVLDVHSDSDAELSHEDEALLAAFCGLIGVFIASCQVKADCSHLSEALQLSEAKYHSILTSIEDGYYEVDLAGNLNFFNDSLCQILGYPADQLMGMNNRDYTDEVNAQKLYNNFHHVYQTGKPVQNFLWTVTHQDGSKGSVETSVSLIKNDTGEPIGFCGISRDVTKRTSVERLLEIRTKAMDASHEPLTIADALQPDMPLIYVNPAFERATGYSIAEVLGKNSRFLQGDDCDQPGLDELRTALKVGRDCIVTLRNYRKDGTLFWNELHISAVRDTSGTVTHFLGSQNDITEREAAREALLQSLSATKERARQLNTLNELATELNQIELREDLFKVVAVKSAEIIQCDRASVAILDEGRQEFDVFAIDKIQNSALTISRATTVNTLLGLAISEKRVVIELDLENSNALDAQGLCKQGIHSIMNVPLMTMGRVMGTLNVASKRANAFGTNEQQIMQQVGSILAATIENRRLFKEVEGGLANVEAQAKRLTKLNNIGTDLALTNSLDEILDVIGSQTGAIIPGDRVIITMLSEDGEHFEYYGLPDSGRKTGQLPLENTWVGEVVRAEQTVITPNLSVVDHLVDARGLVEQGFRCAIATPLRVVGRMMGTLNVVSRIEVLYTDSDKILLQQLGSLLASAIENRRLFKQMQHTLTETEQLYEASAALSACVSYDEMLQVLRKYTIADQAACISIGYFGHSVKLDGLMPDTFQILADWGSTSQAFVQRHYMRNDLPGFETVVRPYLTVHENTQTESYIQDLLKTLYENVKVETVIYAPIATGGQWLGFLGLVFQKQLSSSEADLQQISVLALHLSATVQNLYNLEQTAYTLHQTQILQKFSQTLSTLLESEQVHRSFNTVCVEEAGFEYVQFSLVDPVQQRVRAVSGINVTEDQIRRSDHPLDSADIMADIIRSGQTEIISGWDERFDKENFESEGHANWIRVFSPIILRGDNIGLVEAGFKKGESQLIRESRIVLLKSLINQSAIALDNAQRYETHQKALRREQAIREITEKMRSATNLNQLVKVTAEALGEQFSADLSVVGLGIDSENNPNLTSPGEEVNRLT